MPKRPADLRRAVLDASLALVEEGGVGALSMREVARRARVTHGAPYHHFENRAAILAALAEEGFGILEREMAAAMKREDKGSIARFEAAGRAYFRFATKHAAYMRIMFRPELASPGDHPSVDVAAAAAMRLLIGCVAECQEAGTIPAGDPGPIVLTSWAAIHGLASLWLDGPLCRLHDFRASDPSRVVASTLAHLLTVAAKRA
jgi:AcrR family transcriptional regulator